MRKLSGYPPALGVHDVEPHEARREEGINRTTARHEQIAGERRDRGNDRVGRQQRATLRDLHTLVDVDAGIFTTDDVFGRRHEPQRRDRGDRDGKQDSETGTRCRAIEAQVEPGGSSRRDRDDHVGHEQAHEAVPVRRREREHDRQRHCRRQHDRPVPPLFGGQRRAPLAI